MGDLDVLICVGPRDVHQLMPYSVRSCIRYFEPLRRIVVVTSVVEDVRAVLKQFGLLSLEVPLLVLDDREVLPSSLYELPGWCRQQMIRLHVDQICAGPAIVSLSADTIICRPVTRAHLFRDEVPILYFNRYSHISSHLNYERQRVRNVARLLDVSPTRSLPLGDFIMDLKVLESHYLQELRRYLAHLHGANPFATIVPRQCDSLAERASFGEWTLYAVFLLDVLGVNVPVRNSRNRFVAQVHSRREFDAFPFDARVVHFVDKSFTVPTLYPWLLEWGLAS